MNHKFPCGRTRRQFLWEAGNGFFGTALTWMLAQDVLLTGTAPAATASAQPPMPHIPPKAKACIFLYMVGGPSHLDTFDPKPKLKELHGQQHKFEATSMQTQRNSGKLKGAPWKFTPSGKSGVEVSELLPNLAQCIDDMVVIRSTVTDTAAHGAATLQMNTGFIRPGFPSLGAWSIYGLGTGNQNMPGFVVLDHALPYGRAQNWSAGFLPTQFQGTVFKADGPPVANLKPASGASLDEQRYQLELLEKFNREHQENIPGRGELAARIASYELAYRMQAHAPEGSCKNSNAGVPFESWLSCLHFWETGAAA